MKKYYTKLHKYREIMNNNPNLLNCLKNVNNSDLKVLAAWYYRENDDPLPTTNDDLILRIKNTMHRRDESITEYLIPNGVDEEKLISMDLYPNEDEMIAIIKGKITQK